MVGQPLEAAEFEADRDVSELVKIHVHGEWSAIDGA
jgi:hypothetical protein